MRISSRFLLFVPVVALTWSQLPSAYAQETLAGVGAASAAGAGIGAAAGNMSAQRVTRGARGTDNTMPEDEGTPNFPSPSTTSTTVTTTTTASVPLAGRSGGGSAILGQLLAVPNRPAPTRVSRSPRAQAAYSRRVARMSPKARKKLVLGKYKIPPRGYLAAYLPADRYKFAKAWKYVSTETDRFYYRPQDMARRGFNPNRVIGFRTWQDAMLAGYRPDPITKPEPGSQIAYFASLTRDDVLVSYVEYVYSGQVSPANLESTYRYIRSVKAIIDRTPYLREYQSETVARILEAALTGNPDLIPSTFGQQPNIVAVSTDGGEGDADEASGDSGAIISSPRSSRRRSSLSFSRSSRTFRSGGGTESTSIQTGPRGGRFHLSASGKKVYEPQGSSRSSARRRR